MKEHELGFDTLQVHAGQYPDKETGARAVPIYQTTSFVFKSIEHATDLFSLKAPGNIYTRIMNPTSTVLEKRIAVLEGGIGALAVASGSAAISMAILNIVGAGDEIVSANTLYGGTYNLFAHTLRKLNIRTHFVDPNTISNFEDAIGKRTKAIFIETIGNPSNNIIDIEKVAEIAHLYDLPLIVDNTFGTPYLIRPIDFGADIVVHSATKYICGHGTAIGGLIIDAGKFDWEKSDRFPMLTEQDVSYHGIQYTKKFKEKAYIAKARVQLLRDLGAAISPFNSFLLLQGLETLSLRVEKHVSNAKKVAKFLNGHPKVKWVNYPSLQSNKYHDLAQKYMPKGSGSIFSFGLDGSMDASKTFIENLQLFSLLANVADAKSLVIHPASTTHQQLTENERQVAGITTDMIRLSIGIEDADDLIEDLRQALEKV